MKMKMKQKKKNRKLMEISCREAAGGGGVGRVIEGLGGLE